MSKEAMEIALEALKDSQDYIMGRAMTVEAAETLEEALAKQEQGEPVAYETVVEYDQDGHSVAVTYTTPQPVTESHKRKPLTFEQVEACFQDGGIWGVDGKHLGTTAQGLHDFARAIEAAHGIKE